MYQWKGDNIILRPIAHTNFYGEFHPASEINHAIMIAFTHNLVLLV